MYSNKESVNILTSLLVAHGVKHAVVCPGSRNAPIVHNLNECPDIRCYPVTDERSAGFFALGIAQATDEPVVVCVTSGTALLNLAPAVAEAHYQHQSLIVVSADRPAEWIDQLDGQTLCQPGALEPWVKKTVNLPQPSPFLPPPSTLTPPPSPLNPQPSTLNPQPSPLHWHCNRLVNEALIEATSDLHPCVHINVPLSEPLFGFTVEQLPEERVIRRFTPSTDYSCLPQQLLDDLLHAERPLIVFGQLSPRRFHYEGIDHLFSHIIVLHEALAPFTSVSPFEEVLSSLIPPPSSLTPYPSSLIPPPSPLTPDFILYVGDAIVSKRLKHFLRKAKDACTWRVSLTGEVEDTFQNLRGIVVGDAEAVLQALDSEFSSYVPHLSPLAIRYRRQWLQLLSDERKRLDNAPLTFSEEGAVRLLEQQLASHLSPLTSHLSPLTARLSPLTSHLSPPTSHLSPLTSHLSPLNIHYANSTAIRLANRYAKGHPVWCNRGTNGIEGTLSTAVGFAAVQCTMNNEQCAMTLCIIGDLSFFYDQNALWNTLVPRLNLRILLLNNGHGAIFDHLPGLSQSPAADSLVAGRHQTTAEGICRQCGVDRRLANDMEELQEGIVWLTANDTTDVRLLEVFF